MNWNLVNSEEYKLLMKVANDKILMDTFRLMLDDHLVKHREDDVGIVKREDCRFCLLAMNW